MKYLILFFIICYFLLPQAVHAADSTPSANIKSKYEEFLKEAASMAAKLKPEINKKLANKAYVGKVKQTSSQTLTLATKNGPRIVNITQDTNFDSKVRGKKFSQKLLSEEDYLVSLGDVDENGVLTAREIILLPPDDTLPKASLWGQVVAISDKLITIKNSHGKNIAASLPLSSVKVGDFVILTGNFGKNDIFEAGFVYVPKK